MSATSFIHNKHRAEIWVSNVSVAEEVGGEVKWDGFAKKISMSALYGQRRMCRGTRTPFQLTAWLNAREDNPRTTPLDGVIEHGREQVIAGDLRPALRWKIVIVEKLNVLVIVYLLMGPGAEQCAYANTWLRIKYTTLVGLSLSPDHWTEYHSNELTVAVETPSEEDIKCSVVVAPPIEAANNPPPHKKRKTGHDGSSTTNEDQQASFSRKERLRPCTAKSAGSSSVPTASA
ncbi:hypothetical protein B0H14DRAFT_2585207 [Mycena olivaceomarginata]|nr:hypothetical protein B0H14DRAFT_2585207 [Mycena olivaceomarginata]